MNEEDEPNLPIDGIVPLDEQPLLQQEAYDMWQLQQPQNMVMQPPLAYGFQQPLQQLLAYGPQQQHQQPPLFGASPQANFFQQPQLPQANGINQLQQPQYFGQQYPYGIIPLYQRYEDRVGMPEW